MNREEQVEPLANDTIEFSAEEGKLLAQAYGKEDASQLTQAEVADFIQAAVRYRLSEIKWINDKLKGTQQP
jgi:hypothetical protein